MPEVPFSREDHRDIVFIGGIYGLLVAYRASGLDDGGHTYSSS